LGCYQYGAILVVVINLDEEYLRALVTLNINLHS
jgi:hypothetical protein